MAAHIASFFHYWRQLFPPSRSSWRRNARPSAAQTAFAPDFVRSFVRDPAVQSERALRLYSLHWYIGPVDVYIHIFLHSSGTKKVETLTPCDVKKTYIKVSIKRHVISAICLHAVI